MTARLVALALLLSLQGCGAGKFVSNYFGGEDNSEPPAPLVEFKQTANIVSRWEQNVGGTDEQYLKLSPAVTEESIYTVARSGDIEALSLQNGRTLWSRDVDEPVSSAAGVGAGLVIVGTSNGYVIALDKATGEPRWKKRVSSEVLAPPQAAENIVVVRTVDGKLIGMDAESGDRIWVYDRTVPALSLRGTSTPVIYEGYIIAGFDAGRLLALELTSGKAVWETRIAIGSGRSELERMVDIDSDPVIQNDIIYVATYQGRLAAVSVQGGRILWTRDISSHSGLTVDQEYIYITDDRGHVWALEQVSGSSVWKQEALQARATSAPALVGPYIAVGGVEGYVHWMDRDTGEFVARTRLDESPIIAAPVTINETVFFYSTAGTLTAYTYRQPAPSTGSRESASEAPPTDQPDTGEQAAEEPAADD